MKSFTPRRGPLLIIVMDGVACGKKDEGNAVSQAYTPTLDDLQKKYLNCQLKAHGTAVGLPTDSDMGNSEVGHNALGAGRVYDQGAKLVSQSIEKGEIFSGSTWKDLVKNCLTYDTPLHLIGLLSDGNVHSHINQVFALIRHAHQEGVKVLRLHVLLDGRDVGGTSALQYIDATEKLLAEINEEDNRDYGIASGGGRMIVTMDRYEASWSIVERGWKAHVLGEARPFLSAREAIETYRKEKPGIIDQFLPSFVITKNDQALGIIEDNHSVIFFNFRGDRAIEISRAFVEKNFDKFDRVRFPNVLYAGMMQYDGDLQIPPKFLVHPSSIGKTLGEYLARNEIKQYAVSETQKYGHVTYFWNGNRAQKFSPEHEIYQEILSDLVPFEERPWMKSAEITDAIIDHLEKNQETRFLRINYPNGDMVGHTGDLQATIVSVEAVDLALKRLLPYVKKHEGIALILADHGNADEMYEVDKEGNFIWEKEQGKFQAKTCHTLNPVPFIIYDPAYKGEYKLREGMTKKGLSNVAATALNLLGYEAPEEYDISLIEFSA